MTRTTTKPRLKKKTKTVTTKRPAHIVAAVLGVAFLISTVAAKDDHMKPYGLIFGTAYGPDDRPLYGVRVIIHLAGHKSPHWELMSDHRGEFAQRVPPGPSDYEISGEAVIAPIVDGKPQSSKKKQLKGSTRVHLDKDERQDIGLHLN
jgi:hypothetical protein